MSQTPEPGDRDDPFETIAPADVRLTRSVGDAGAAEAPRPPRGTDRRALLALAALAIAAVVGFALLPEPGPPEIAEPVASPADAPAPRPSAPSASRAEAGEDEVPPFEAMRLQQERAAAQEVLERMLSLTERLRGRAVERWGADAMARARALAEEGDALFLQRDYPQAQRRYRDAVDALEALDARAAQITETQLELGEAALDAGDAAAATDAFEFAVAVTPGSEAARIGLERAAVLDAVRTRLRDAERALEDGAVTAARGLVDEALELDARSEAARSLAARIDARSEAIAFTGAMSDGFAALRAGRFDAAETRFADAARLRPGAPEIAEARRILAAERTAARIGVLQREAEALAADEDWAAAAERYAAALELDGTLAFARRGLERARMRAELDEAVQDVLAHTERLNDDAAWAEADALLDRARAQAPRTARLAAQIAELEEALRIAATPVAVTLRSDGRTEVTLQRVARLGTFETTTLPLKPGAYVATGARVGFRDVRVEFLVTADGTEAPVTVRCETRI